MYCMLCIIYYVLYVMYCMLCILCYVLCIMYWMLFIVCYVPYIMYHILCIVGYVLYVMYYISCILCYVLYVMYGMLCIVLYGGMRHKVLFIATPARGTDGPRLLSKLLTTSWEFSPTMTDNNAEVFPKFYNALAIAIV